MKHVRLFPILAALLFAFACTDDPLEGAQPSPDPASNPSNHRVPVETALADLESMLAQLDEPATRGGAPRRVGAVTTVKAVDLLPATRSGEKPALDELVYLANFDGGEGYALLGADDRMPSIIAITDRGSLTPDELAAAVGTVPTFSADNPPAVIPEVAAYLGATASGGIVGVGELVHPAYGPWTELFRLSSMIRVKWDQSAPYNLYCPVFGNKRAPVGCVAVALGLIASMNIYDGKYPASSISGIRPFKWSEIITAIDTLEARPKRRFEVKNDETPEAKAVASLLRTIGETVKMEYTPGGSYASSENAALFLTQRLGYKNVSLATFSQDAIYEMIQKKLPVYIEGWYKIADEEPRGHAWVIDGWSRQQRVVKIYSTLTGELLRTEVEYRDLCHCNYGWRGTCDGYYFLGIFTLTKSPPYRDVWVGDAEAYRTDDLHNLNSDLKIITYSPFF